MQRANILLKQGLFTEAIKDYETIVNFVFFSLIHFFIIINLLKKIKNDQGNTEATGKLDKIYSILNDLGQAKRYMANRDFMPAVDLLTNILEVLFYHLNLNAS